MQKERPFHSSVYADNEQDIRLHRPSVRLHFREGEWLRRTNYPTFRERYGCKSGTQLVNGDHMSILIRRYRNGDLEHFNGY